MSRRSLICLPPSPPNHNSPFISYHFSATGENPSSGDPSCCASPTVPRSPPGHSGLRSESSYLLGDIRLHPRVPFRRQEADPTECWASNPKSERRTHRTPDTPNFRHPGTCHRKAMVAPSPNGAITGLTSPRYLKEDRPRSRITAGAGTKPEAAARLGRLEAVKSGSKHAARLHRKLTPNAVANRKQKGIKYCDAGGRSSS